MSEDLKGLLGYIYGHESGGDYDRIYSGVPKNLYPPKPLTSMTVQEVLEWQKSVDPYVNSEAVGALQIIPGTLAGLVNDGVVSPTDMFDGPTQDRMTVALMRKRGLDAWQEGRISTQQFGTRLAMEWASLPVLEDTYRGKKFVPRGNAYYGGVGSNPEVGFDSAETFEAVLANPGEYSPHNWRVATSGRQAMDPGGAIYQPGAESRLTSQAMLRLPVDPHDYPGMGGGSVRALAGLPGRMEDGGQVEEGPGLPSADYFTRTGAGGGPVVGAGWVSAFVDELSDSFIVRGLKSQMAARRYDYDREFDPIQTAMSENMSAHWEYLSTAKNRQHYDYLKRQVAADAERNKRREVYDGWVAPLLGAMLSPDSIVSLGVGGMAVSGARVAGANFVRTLAGTTALTAGFEAGMETGRSQFDPFATPSDSIMRVAGATAFAGVFNGVLAAALTPAARRSLGDRIGREMALERGLGKTTEKVDLGGRQGDVLMADDPAGLSPSIRTVNGKQMLVGPDSAGRGVVVVGDKVVVDPRVIAWRMADKERLPEGIKTANELVEYEVGFAAAMKRKLKRFTGDEKGSVGPEGYTADAPYVRVTDEGEIEVDRARLDYAIFKGDPIRLGDGVPGRTPIEIDPDFFRSTDEAEAFIRAAHDAAVKARDDGEFRMMVEGIFTSLGDKLSRAETPEARAKMAEAQAQAEAEAEIHLESWRRENNKILQNAKIEAMARLMDSPYKRIHRNAKHPYTRDLVDKLAADGTFARGSDSKGLTVGPSVYARAKTWQGLTRRLWDQERELYAKMLGMESNPTFGDVSLSDFKRKKVDGTAAMSMTEFRHRTSVAYITGKKSGVPEIDQMVENLRAVYDEYSQIADEFGVINGRETIGRRIAQLESRLEKLTARDPRGESVRAQLEQLMKKREEAGSEPSESYFTRVYSKKAIRENRDAFREKIVMPWMMQNPWVEVWQPSKAEIQGEIDHLVRSNAPQDRIDALIKRRDSAPNRSEWKRVEASTKPADVMKRADELIETILEEADPDDLATLREAHRPTFGRRRQFDIANSMLLREGTEGNGIADFIETDYLLTNRIYADRMGPAIEMARTFGRPVDGVSARDGFEAAMKQSQEAEADGWVKAREEEYREALDLAAEKAGAEQRKEILDAPAKLEIEEAKLKDERRKFARAKELQNFAMMSDEDAAAWVLDYEARAKVAWMKKKPGAGEEMPDKFVRQIKKSGEDLYERIRMKPDGVAHANKMLEDAKATFGMARARYEQQLRLVNLTSDQVDDMIEEAAREIDQVSVIEKAGGGRFSDHWAPIERDLLHLRDRVMNRVIRAPERWDNRAAAVLRNWSHLAFMGMSALPALQEIGTLVMRHGVGRLWRGPLMDMSEASRQVAAANIGEMRAAGAILDTAMGGALSRFAETGMDPVTGTAPERWLRSASNKYFLWNGLAPLTTRLKEIDASLRVHKMVETIDKVYRGHGTPDDLKELARWGISKEDAQAIGRNEPIFQTEEGHWQANTAAWGSEDLVRKFRAALVAGNENAVLLASAADKPIISDGTVYIRKSPRVNKYAERAGLEDSGEYWRMQSGLMTLPFTFWNYSIAATNKILLSGLDEQSSQKLGGIAALVGLGFMVAQMRTDENQWDSMGFEDKLAKAIDQSGVVGVLGNYANLTQGMSIATTGINPLPFDRTRGMRNPDMGNMAVSLMGAGPSALTNFVGGAVNGDAEQFSWGLPFRNHIALKWLFDGAVDGMARTQSGVD